MCQTSGPGIISHLTGSLRCREKCHAAYLALSVQLLDLTIPIMDIIRMLLTMIRCSTVLISFPLLTALSAENLSLMLSPAGPEVNHLFL